MTLRTFTLAATNAAGSAQASVSASVADAPPPPTGSVLDTIAAGTARRYGTYVNPDPDWIGKGMQITDDSGCAMDVARRQFLLFGGSHGVSQENDIRAFSLVTGTWSSLYPSTPWAAMLTANLDFANGRWIADNLPVCRHTYSHMVIRGVELFIMQSFCNPDYLPEGILPYFHAPFAIYNFTTKAWRYSARKMPWFHASASVLDPVSGMIYTIGANSQGGSGGMWKYDPVADTLTTGPSFGITSQPLDFVYHPPSDSFYMFENSGVVRRVVINRTAIGASTCTLLTTAGALPPHGLENTPTGRPRGYPSFAWDGKRFGGSFIDGVHYSFDPTTLTWTGDAVTMEAGSVGFAGNDFACSEFDPVTGCYVFVQSRCGAPTSTWAYRS